MSDTDLRSYLMGSRNVCRVMALLFERQADSEVHGGLKEALRQVARTAELMADANDNMLQNLSAPGAEPEGYAPETPKKYGVWAPSGESNYARSHGITVVTPPDPETLRQRVLSFTREEAEVMVQALNEWNKSKSRDTK